jgi:hypothetical protein
MSSLLCTLYEKRYDRGVGALVNSLVAAGFTGTVHVGYRGALPYWIGQCTPLPAAAPGVSTYRAGALTLVFTALSTDFHLANFKPHFMAQLLDAADAGVERVLYFDPDIVVKCPWEYFESWAGEHVAVCSDIASECGPTHPLRQAWARHFAPLGLASLGRMTTYVNSGFVGVPRAHRALLATWARAQELMAPLLGGMGAFKAGDRTFMFHHGDQDALNVALDACAVPLSVAGQDAMDFGGEGYVMAHAYGVPKPWDKRFFLRALGGQPPTRQDKHYWNHVRAPIALYGALGYRWGRFGLALGSLLGRFYRRA